MIIKKVSFIIILYTLISCNGNSVENQNHIKSLKIEESVNQKNAYTISEYNSRAKEIIENGKSKLEVLMPVIIHNQIDLYKDALLRIEHQYLLTYSYSESLSNINAIRNETMDSLLINELKVNKIYYETINNLSILNQTYSKRYNIEFQDYYNVAPFILADDVLSKINELILDDEYRKKNIKRSRIIDIGLFIINLIPGIGQVTRVIADVAIYLRHLKKSIKATNMASKILKDKFIPVLYNRISNKEKRIRLSSETSYKAKTYISDAIVGYSNSNNFLNNKKLKKINNIFRSPNNKLLGRIGDFSDGVLTQPIANLREIKKDNIKVLNSKIK